MACDEGLVERVRELMEPMPGFGERRMFGGVCFTINNYMAVGVNGSDLMCRVGPHRYENALGQTHVREMDFTGRPMKGYVFVSDEGTASDDNLERWVGDCVEFVRTLPPKKAKKQRSS